MKYLIKFLPALFLISSSNVLAQESILSDNGGDDIVTYMGFGDSITFGVGDTAFPEGAGYVTRLGALLNIPVINEGVPGEEIVANGVYRFPDTLNSSKADIVGVMEGANDAIKRQDATVMRNAYQRVVNVARASGRDIVLMTLPAPCCDHAAGAPFTDNYSNVALDVANLNEIRIADFRKAWQTTCSSPFECNLYNLPEGLHPNGTGYDVMAQTLAATLLGIDIFSEGGAAELESALSLEPGVVIVKPLVTE